MMRKINCPWHDDNTASMHIYPTHAHCYGCGKHVKLGELEKATDGEFKRKDFRFRTVPAAEDMQYTLGRIAQLPTKLIRGFVLPYDALGYYIVYPNTPYYSKRLWQATDGDKYRSPKGHKKPLYVPNPGWRCVYSKDITVVEGQLNALSAVLADVDMTVVSPGGAGDMNRPDFVKFYLQYEHVYVIVDKDAAGVAAAVTLRDTLLKHRKKVTILPMEQDCNEIYAEKGKEALREYLNREMAVSG